MNYTCSNNFVPTAVSLNYNCPGSQTCNTGAVNLNTPVTNTCGTACCQSSCGCSAVTACGCSGSVNTAFTPAFLSAFTTTPRFHVQGCPAVFDRMNSMPRGISVNCEGNTFTVAETGMYRVFYTAQTELTSETLFRISVNGNTQAGTEICACPSAQMVSADAILPINACDSITLNVLSDNTALLRSIHLSIVRVA